MIAPGVMANRARRHERRVRRRDGVTDLAVRLVGNGAAVVQAGPFEGMRYPAQRLPQIDAAIAKLLGTYEQEIAWVFERAIAERVPVFVDIGSADGYYAAGMAHASADTTVHAYDLASSARGLCAATAAASAVADRVRIGTRFRLDAAGPAIGTGALVLCDIEGAEADLLDATAALKLAHSVVVVEVHEDERPGAAKQLSSAFAETHDAVTIRQSPRMEIPAALRGWRPDEQVLALNEFRGPELHWIVFEPKAGAECSAR